MRASAQSSLGRLSSGFGSFLDVLPAGPLLVGVVLGFGFCCWAGRTISRRPIFEHFSRFYAPITVPYLFYPTASEMVAQVRAQVPKNKILVVVGGSSYFQGAGMGRDELWTDELQRRLGSRFGVINLAMPGASGTSGAGVAFQILAREYPRIVYVTTASPVSVDALDGGAGCTTAFWDAFYKGLLTGPDSWKSDVEALAAEECATSEGAEIHLGKRLDRFTYACDLWNYIGYEDFFTVWCDLLPGSMMRARRLYADGDAPGTAGTQRALRQNRDYRAVNETGLRGFFRNGFKFSADGTWEPDRPIWDMIASGSVKSYPMPLHDKIYFVLVQPNPYYEQTFSPDDWRRHDALFAEGKRAHESAGYRVIALPDSTFTADDFIDAGHYMASGGRKLAKVIADRILSDTPGG